jgi:multidrug resistance efflux pump
MEIKFRNKKAQDAEMDGHIKLDYGPSKRNFPKFGWYAILLLAASPILYFIVSLLYHAVSIRAPGYVTFEKIAIRAPAEGMIIRIWAAPGNLVAKDSKLIQLDNSTLNAQIQMLTKQYQDIENYSLEDSQKIIANLEASRVVAEDEVAFYSDQFAKMKQLYEEQELGIPAYNSAKESLLTAQYRLQDINVQISKQRQQDLRDLSDENSYLEKKKFLAIEIQSLSKQINALTIRSPVSAKVIDKFVAPGEYTQIGSQLFTLASLQHPFITAYLDPKYAEHANVGRKVTIHFANGDDIEGIVKQDPQITRKLPVDLVGPVATASVKVLVIIEPLEKIPAVVSIEGLPVTVKFS